MSEGEPTPWDVLLRARGSFDRASEDDFRQAFRAAIVLARLEACRRAGIRSDDHLAAMEAEYGRMRLPPIRVPRAAAVRFLEILEARADGRAWRGRGRPPAHFRRKRAEGVIVQQFVREREARQRAGMSRDDAAAAAAEAVAACWRHDRDFALTPDAVLHILRKHPEVRARAERTFAHPSTPPDDK